MKIYVIEDNTVYNEICLQPSEKRRLQDRAGIPSQYSQEVVDQDWG